MNMGYHSNLKDICKIMAVFMFALDVLQFFTYLVTFPDSHHMVFTFRSWLDLLDVVLAFWISILKISKLLQNCWHGVIDNHKLRKTFGKFFISYS